MDLTYPKFDHTEIELVEKCLESKWVTSGPFVRQFEEIFKQRHAVDFALATTSCTAALHLAMLALGIGSGDEVVVPAFTWVTSANCVEYVGARAVLAEVEAETFNLDPEAFEAAITPNTRAVVVVHLFGLPARMDRILEIARKHDLYVVEDAACAIGTTYDGQPVGGLGDMGCFSFHPRKVITTGEGGMVSTNHNDLADIVASLRNHGSTGPSQGDRSPQPWQMATFNRLGYNLRLSDIQAAVGVAQMAKLDALLQERLEVASRYNSLLEDIEEIAIPAVPNKCGHTYQSYVIRVLQGGRSKRNSIMTALAEKGIQTRPGTHAVHRLGYYADKYGLSADAFPTANACEETSITLPLFPGMTADDIQRVVAAIKDAFI